jgi:tetratricopeptide (TPR) repeat protein
MDHQDNPRGACGSRPRHLPPPVIGLTENPGPEGLTILREVNGAGGTILWRSFRTVATWAMTAGGYPPQGAEMLLAERRAQIAAAELADELIEPTHQLAEVLNPRNPPSGESIAAAAARIARWASNAGHHYTAVEFSQLASASDQRDPVYALDAARAAYEISEYSRAETWVHRAIGLARTVGEWKLYSEAHLLYGRMLQRRKDPEGAQRWVERALRRANRQGHVLLQAHALHDLFVIAAERRQWNRAERLAERALAVFPEGADGRARLLEDLSAFKLQSARGQRTGSPSQTGGR